MEELSPGFAEEVRATWHRFLQRTESVRPDLHRYCRSLTGSVWDAEDLVQDTLLRAFAKLGEYSNPIDNPKAYLFRIASNLWVDRFRRAEMIAMEEPVTTGSPEQPVELRDAAKQLIRLLSPQERAAVVLKDVFDYRLEEIAAILQTTVGAIKAALHRGREKLAATNSPRAVTHVNEALLDQFVEAFNARDLDRLTALLRTDAVDEVIGIGSSHGRTAIRDGSLYYGLFLEKGEPRAERYAFLGEPIVLIWYALLDDPTTYAVRDVLRFEESEDQITRLRYYTFCPETIAELTGALCLPFATNGYGNWSPEFIELRKEEEFQQWRASQHPEWVDSQFTS